MDDRITRLIRIIIISILYAAAIIIIYFVLKFGFKINSDFSTIVIISAGIIAVFTVIIIAIRFLADKSQELRDVEQVKKETDYFIAKLYEEKKEEEKNGK